MDVTRRMLLLFSVLLASSFLAGCAELGLDPMPQQGDPVPFVRAEHLCATLEPDKTDINAIKKDLGTLLSNVERGVYIVTNGEDYLDYGIPATEAGITARNGMGFKYADLLNLRFDFISPDQQNTYPGHPHGVQAWAVLGLYFVDEDLARCVAQEIFFLQDDLRRKYSAQALAGFEPLAEAYRAQAVKPEVPEEQRRYVVQANSWVEQKQYAMALATYGKALQIDPVAYPAAYYNMALMYAQENRPYEAIVSMKKYILLVPDAEDARTAQDKIYGWEGLAGVH